MVGEPVGFLEYDQPDPAEVEQLLGVAAARWHLEMAAPLAGGFRSQVFGATGPDGADLVVKLAVNARETAVEAEALRAWVATGAAVVLVDFHPDAKALLIERVRPATPLPPGEDDRAVAVAVDLLARLHLQPPPLAFWPLTEVFPHWEARARADAAFYAEAHNEPERGAVGLSHLELARRAAAELSGSVTTPVLLHGDFCDKNLFWDGQGFRAADPIAMVGDPCSDIGFFSAGHPPAAAILGRAEAIADGTGEDPGRARRWAAIWTVMQATQAWREDQAALENLILTNEFRRVLAPG